MMSLTVDEFFYLMLILIVVAVVFDVLFNE